MGSAPTSHNTISPSESWLSGPLGDHLLRQEQALVDQALEKMFGFQLLQVGTWGKPRQFVQNSKTLRQAVIAEQDIDDIDIVAHPWELPVASDSVDAVILPHTLENNRHPHQTLREVQRVLVGEGQLLILGFSPISIWGLRRYSPNLIRRADHPPFITEHRLRDWLHLLGLEAVEAHKYFYSLPINKKALLEKTQRLESFGHKAWPFLNGAYMLAAKKSMLRAATVGPRWHRRRRVIGGLAEPATRTADTLGRIRLDRTGLSRLSIVRTSMDPPTE